jgi:dUTP pyrophosphatase
MIHGLYTIATRLSDGARLPEKAHGDEDAAFDLHASESAAILPGGRTLVKTGVSVEIPQGCAGLVLPRSGLAMKDGITLLNAPGLIDPGYRGEIGVVLHKPFTAYDVQPPECAYDPVALNSWISDHSFFVFPGSRIAQLLIVPTTAVHFTSRDALSESVRGVGGFGSTGL